MIPRSLKKLSLRALFRWRESVTLVNVPSPTVPEVVIMTTAGAAIVGQRDDLSVSIGF